MFQIVRQETFIFWLLRCMYVTIVTSEILEFMRYLLRVNFYIHTLMYCPLFVIKLSQK